MTVDLARARVLADRLVEHFALDTTAETIRRLCDEVEGLRDAIRKAPHYHTCPQSPTVDTSGWASDACCCWKAQALGTDHNPVEVTPPDNSAALDADVPPHMTSSPQGDQA